MKKKHRHKWVEHDCGCHMCDYYDMKECNCGKWKEPDGTIRDY